MAADHKSALARAQKMVANPRAFNRDNLALAVAYLEAHALLKYTTKEADLWCDEARGAPIADSPLMERARAVTRG